MSGFRLDHVWVTAEDRDEACVRLSQLTGLPILDGWAPDGLVRSRGVRFGNGPFLDVHTPDSGEGPAAALLSGSLAEAEALAAREGWSCVADRAELAPAAVRPPWSLLMFKRGQGVLTHLGVIDYAADPKDWPVRPYAGKLFEFQSRRSAGARLDRVWIGPGGAVAERQLETLGLPSSDPEVALTAEATGVVRLEVSGGVAAGIVRVGPLQVEVSV